jgi:hypothetical protein
MTLAYAFNGTCGTLSHVSTLHFVGLPLTLYGSRRWFVFFGVSIGAIVEVDFGKERQKKKKYPALKYLTI